MDGLMMDYNLTLPTMLRQAESLYSHKEIVTRTSQDSFSEDGWLRTGDIATVDEKSYVELKDRTKDLIKAVVSGSPPSPWRTP